MPIAHQVIDQRDMCFADSTNRKHSGGSRTGYLFSGLKCWDIVKKLSKFCFVRAKLGYHMFW